MYNQVTDMVDDVGDHLFALSIIFGALVTLYVKVVKPIVRAARTVHDRWGDISEHEEAITRIETKVDTVETKVDTVETKVNHIEGIATETVGRVAQIENHVGINNNGTGTNG